MPTASSRRSGHRFALLVLLAALAAACSKSSNANSGGTAAAGAATDTSARSAADTATSLRGTVVSASAGTLVIKANTGTDTLALAQPFAVYDREPGTLADVKDGTFIGVTTVKQPDGAEQAREIHVFPDALRGLGEGSRMMTPPAGTASTSGGSGSRMTNGAVSGSRMTNGSATAAPPSRMSNGSVAGANGSSLVVTYAGGSQHVTVPSNTTVTVIKATSTSLAPGENVYVLTKRSADGKLQATGALLVGR
jgi:hypothetical protein